MNNKNQIWVFDDGLQTYPCVSFPFAFRQMFNSLKKGIDNGRDPSKMKNVFSIVSPMGKLYSYSNASDLATQQGLLQPDGSLNSKEFKRR
jgi:hypothetical protein